jgi:energy-coupling factor transporter ATP-binding protein EcfA2
MLKRVYASNFRTLINFDVGLDALTLLLGPNGAGKTSIFDVVRLVRDFLRGEPVWIDGKTISATTTELFPISTLTRWQDVDVQTFELALAGRGGEFVYHLEIEHERLRQRCRVRTEKLTFDGRPLFESSLHDNQLTAQLFRDDGSRGPTQLTDWTRSSLPSIQPRPENQLMTWFKERMNRVIVARFNPAVIGARAEDESPTLDWDASNFVAWFRHVANLDLELVAKLRPLLEEVITGLVGLSLDPDGADAKILKARFRVGASAEASSKPFMCRFDELSDGQRVLLMLYTLLVAAIDDSTICIDEPENFVALREINPWLNMLLDKTQTQSCQAILISHHPELINALAVGSGRWIDRAGDAESRAQSVSEDGSELSIAELVARGWLHA